MTTSVLLLASRLMAPFVPAVTMAALPTTAPVGEFSVVVAGVASPVGQAIKDDTPAGGTTVMLNEYACAVAGTLQPLC
jgi:hypothetical protein